VKTRIFLFLAFALCSFSLCANNSLVKKDYFKTNIDSINVLLSIYDTLSPFEDHDGNEEDTIFQNSMFPNKHSIEFIQGEIIDLLREVLNDKKIKHSKIQELFPNNNSLFISCSEDSRLCMLSLDEKTGGTFRSTITLIHYRLSDGSIHTELAEGYNGSYTIYTLNPKKPAYFVLGSTITCTTCVNEEAYLFNLDSASYNAELFFDYYGRYYDLLNFSFNPEVKSFYYDYFVTGEEDALYRDGHNYPADLVCHRSGRYTYYDGEFLEMEMNIIWEERASEEGE
jgi:hypothetical protein